MKPVSIAVIAIAAALSACATTPELPPDVQQKSVVMDVEYSNTAAEQKHKAGDELSKVKPEPVYSTSYAINLAELALKGAGVNGTGRNILVSYCDGVYTVTFARPEDDTLGCDFAVDIESETSRVLKVVTAK